MIFLRFCLLYCISLLHYCKITLPTWASPSLINSGQHVFRTSGSIDITYQNAFASQPKKIIFSISQIDFNSSTHYLNFTNTILGEYTTKVTINLVIFNFTQIYSQTFNYMTIDSSVSGISTNSILSLQVQASGLKATMNNLTYGTGFRYLSTLNNLPSPSIQNHDNYISLFVAGFSMYTNKSFWNISIVYSLPNLFTYIFRGQTSSNISVTGIYFCRLSVDKTIVQSTKLNYVDLGIFTVTPNSINYFTSNFNYYATSAFLIGLKVFDFGDSSQINYSYNFTNMSFSVSSSCNKMEFNYFNYRTRKCPPTQPYFQEISGLCFDICDLNYFTNTTITACLPCWYTCKSCMDITNISCLTCDINNHRILINNSCVCMDGYYNETNCVKCADNCMTCSNSSSCILYYSTSLNMTLKFESSQEFNHFYLFVIFNEPFLNSSKIETITNVTLNGFAQNFTLVNVTNTSITLLFQYSASYENAVVNVQFVNKSITDQSNHFLMNQTSVTNINELYYYSPQEIWILNKILNVFQLTSTKFTVGYNIIALTTTLYLFLNIIQFSQILSLYLFLDIQLPIHLKKFIESVYEIINQNILPFPLPNPFCDTIDFDQPPVFIQESQNFNFMENNIYNIGEIMLFTVIYILLNFLFKKIKLREGLLRTLKNKYLNNLVTNILTLIISFQIPMTFVAATTLLDFSNLTHYKLLNSILGVIFLFIGMISLFLLYVYLKNTKKLKQYRTQQNYEFFKRNSQYSQQLLLMKAFLEFTLIVNIVLSKPIICLFIIFILIVIYILAIFRRKSNFELPSIYILHLIEIHMHCFFHIIIFFFYYVNSSNHMVSVQNKKIIGYVAIASIIVNFLVSIVSIIISLIHEICQYSLNKKVKPSENILKQEIVKIAKQRLKIQILRTSKVDTHEKQFTKKKKIIKVSKFSTLNILKSDIHVIQS